MREIYQGLVSNPNNAIDNAQNMSITHTFGGTPVVTVPKDTFDISLSVDPKDSGTVSGSGSFEEGTEITVEATPAEGYEFDGWYENGALVSENASYTFTVSGARTLVAKFNSSSTPVSLKTSGGQNVWCESKDGYTEVTFNHNSFNGKWNGYYGDDWVANLPSGKKHRFTFTFNSGVSSNLTLHFIVATDSYGDWNDSTKVVDEVIEAGSTSFQYDVNNTSYKYVQLVNTGTSGAKLGVVSVTREEINV